MSATIPASGAPGEFAPLPPRPNLEFERKRAKKLLRRCRAGEPAALARRARHWTDDAPTVLDDLQLADAQFTIAREYGFASWSKLVAYFATWDRHARAQPVRSTYGPEHYRDRVRSTISGHSAKSWAVAPALAAYVPRCYGKGDAEILSAPLSEAEAQLAVARGECFASWDALMATAAKTSSERNFQEAPFGRAQAAIKEEDVAAVKTIVTAHPELLAVADSGVETGSSILHSALFWEKATRSAKAREISDWLVSRGADLTRELNRGLIGWMKATREDFEFLLDRGADPNWVPPNGISVLEHVLLRCWNPGPADLIAARVVPRDAFWIAAGLGDVRAMNAYFNRDGSITDAARNDRPDFTAVGPLRVCCRPDVDDRDILWEGFLVAGLNHRAVSIDFLIERGFPIDYSPWRFNLLHWAVGNRILPMVKILVERGADLDLKGWQPHASAREMAAENFREHADEPTVRRIYELCRPS